MILSPSSVPLLANVGTVLTQVPATPTLYSISAPASPVAVTVPMLVILSEAEPDGGVPVSEFKTTPGAPGAVRS